MAMKNPYSKLHAQMAADEMQLFDYNVIAPLQYKQNLIDQFHIKRLLVFSHTECGRCHYADCLISNFVTQYMWLTR